VLNEHEGPTVRAMEAKAELSKPQEPLIVDLLGRYFAGRNAGAWIQKAKLGNLKLPAA